MTYITMPRVRVTFCKFRFLTTPSFFLFSIRFKLYYVEWLCVVLCFSIITNINPKSYFYKVLPCYFWHNRSFYIDITREGIYYLCMEFIISQLFFDILKIVFFFSEISYTLNEYCVTFLIILMLVDSYIRYGFREYLFICFVLFSLFIV